MVYSHSADLPSVVELTPVLWFLAAGPDVLPTCEGAPWSPIQEVSGRWKVTRSEVEPELNKEPKAMGNFFQSSDAYN